jgi:hypothetical protein
MEINGLQSAGELQRTAIMVNQVRKLMELQGEMVAKLLESARLPGPSETSARTGIDIRV